MRTPISDGRVGRALRRIGLHPELWAGLSPNGITQQKPRHYRDMARIAVDNAHHPKYAWDVLTKGVCDGCALGVAGLHDWTIDGVHLCTTRLELLELNTYVRFGAFAYDPAQDAILFVHSILGGTTLDRDELTATLRDVALIADEYDDKLVKKYGGQRMLDLLEEAAIENLMDKHPDKFDLKS